MIQEKDEILIWKYVDGLATEEEAAYLLRRAATDAEIDSELHWARETDSAMLTNAKTSLSIDLRSKIITSNSSLPNKEKISSQGWMKPGLQFFAFFNIAVFALGIFILCFIPFKAQPGAISVLVLFLKFLSTPIMQTALTLCIGIFFLLLLDQWLRKHNQGRLTTPV
jgi:hypothetical protein